MKSQGSGSQNRVENRGREAGEQEGAGEGGRSPSTTSRGMSIPRGSKK